MGFFDKLKQGLTKTGRLLKTDVRDLFKSEGRLIDDAFLDEIRAILFKTDMGYDAVEQIVEQVSTDFRGRVVTLDQILDTWKRKLKDLMAPDAVPISGPGGSPGQGTTGESKSTPHDAAPIRFAPSGPTVIMICGVNGTGKTTTIAKLAHEFKSQGKSVLLGAGDTFRAAAVQQLTIWSERLGVPIVTGESGSHPAAVAYRAVAQAIQSNIDVCIIDTAGRLQTQRNLMAELTKIQDSIKKQLPEAPHEVLLVLDATTGQNGISQATKFTEAVKCTGIVLAKLDGTAKGGVVVAIRQQVGLPVKYLGVGEKPEDLTPFLPDQFVDALFAEVAAAPATNTA